MTIFGNQVVCCSTKKVLTSPDGKAVDEATVHVLSPWHLTDGILRNEQEGGQLKYGSGGLQCGPSGRVM